MTLVRELESCHVYKKKFEVGERCSADQAGAWARALYPRAPAGRASQTTKAAVDDVSAEYARNQVARDTHRWALPLRPRGRPRRRPSVACSGTRPFLARVAAVLQAHCISCYAVPCWRGQKTLSATLDENQRLREDVGSMVRGALSCGGHARYPPARRTALSRRVAPDEAIGLVWLAFTCGAAGVGRTRPMGCSRCARQIDR